MRKIGWQPMSMYNAFLFINIQIVKWLPKTKSNENFKILDSSTCIQ